MVMIFGDDLAGSNVDVDMETVAEEDVGVAQQSNKKNSSDVWNSFWKKVEKNNDGTDVLLPDGTVPVRAFCKVCNTSLVCGGSNGKIHLKRHIIGCGKKSSSVVGQSIIGVTDDGVIYTFTFNKEVARRETTRFFIVEDLSFNKVDKESYRRWIRLSFGPQHKSPCRQTMRNDVINTFLEYKVALKGLFAKIPGKISLTSDMWTSNQKLGYMVITAHYISSDWVLQKRIISFPMLPSPHTRHVIYEALYPELLSWEITEKIQSLTLDNPSNNDSAVSLLKNALFDVDDVRRDLVQICCNAHAMNMVVKDGLDHVKASIENI